MQAHSSKQERRLLGKLGTGDKKLEGKTFYLDNVKKRATTLLLEAISLLGGRVESFLHRDVTFVVTGSQECLREEKSAATKDEEKGLNGGREDPTKKRDIDVSKNKQQPATPRIVACGSRGKALLEKAMSNNERQQRNSVLSNAQSWGVKILYVDDVLLYLRHLTRESFSAKLNKKPESLTKQSLPAVKATALRPPYLKIEDVNRKCKPLHMQSVAFPSLYFLGRFSPFESPPPPLFGQDTGQGSNKNSEKKVEKNVQDKSPTQLSCSPSPWRRRKKDTSYCECCHESFTNLEEHLHSDKHRSFVLDPSNYEALDQLVAEMLPGFNPSPPEQSEESTLPTALPIDDSELELCTDFEAEHTVQILKRNGSSISPPSCSVTSLSPAEEINVTSSSSHATHVQDHVLSPAEPVGATEPVDQQLETACPDAPCFLPDPYSLPPVLSPQLPDSYSSTNPHSPYSEPPVLSPQKYHLEETWEPESYEINNEETGSTLEEARRRKSVCDRSLQCPIGSSSRSSSLPQSESGVAPNHRKRCRSASPEHRSSKRRKTAERNNLTSDNMPIVVGRSLFGDTFDPLRHSLTERAPQQTCSTFSSSALQSFPSTHFRINPAAGQPPCLLPEKATDFNFPAEDGKPQNASSGRESHSLSTSMCIEPGLIPNLALHSLESSDSDWDCDLLSRLDRTSAAPQTAGEQSCALDQELLHRPCPWMHDNSYESHLHTVLQPVASPALCGEDVDAAAFSRTVVQIVEVQH